MNEQQEEVVEVAEDDFLDGVKACSVDNPDCEACK
jgi:hypothetical protein